ncbi:unnamed protein product [Symbiodinium necroappetens]|uniref:Uncharacterized protein n=1 Tax=Symbiodinium necroappetens TaxID=1628268 RepID=A0A812ITQ9_9DINO|nr:unnamed protein product [Symbiodinium necroappetens]
MAFRRDPGPGRAGHLSPRPARPYASSASRHGTEAASTSRGRWHATPLARRDGTIQTRRCCCHHLCLQRSCASSSGWTIPTQCACWEFARWTRNISGRLFACDWCLLPLYLQHQSCFA